jgi:predicted dehydrogenase
VTGIGIVGCGFVADYYASTLAGYSDLDVVTVADRDADRARRFAAHHGFTAAESPDDLLADERVDLVVNLTNPRSHVEVTTAALEAGKHVYSEKPLAMEITDALRLVELAESKDLQLSAAPCSLLGECAQTLWKAIRERRVGTIRLVYAEMDEGLVHQMPYRYWTSSAGAPWPARDEFEVGTVIEHAGYVTSWLPAMFGPVESVRGFADCRIRDKDGASTDGTDLSIGILTFASGVIARVSCTLIAPHDHSLRVIGDDGVLSTQDTWFYDSKVSVRRSMNIRQRHQWLPKRRIAPARAATRHRYRGGHQMDFARGIADLAEAVRVGRPPRLSARYCLHVNEITLALSSALRTGSEYRMTTTCGPVAPMPWAAT